MLWKNRAVNRTRIGLRTEPLEIGSYSKLFVAWGVSDDVTVSAQGVVKNQGLLAKRRVADCIQTRVGELVFRRISRVSRRKALYRVSLTQAAVWLLVALVGGFVVFWRCLAILIGHHRNSRGSVSCAGASYLSTRRPKKNLSTRLQHRRKRVA